MGLEPVGPSKAKETEDSERAQNTAGSEEEPDGVA